MPKSSSNRGLVLVTGGSGYIAGYCIAQLLNAGWRVRATVRTVARTKAVRASIGDIAAKAPEIDFVPADLNSDASWSRAARLMGVGDDYRLPGNYLEAYGLMADGLVVPVVRHLAAHTLEPRMAAKMALNSRTESPSPSDGFIQASSRIERAGCIA
jgi:nucleoside-diphosphate-sugar epimerase